MKRKRLFNFGVAGLVGVALSVGSACADMMITVTGNAQVVPQATLTAATGLPGDTGSPGVGQGVRVFFERLATLAQPQTVDLPAVPPPNPSGKEVVIPKGTNVESFFLHAQRPSSATDVTYTGTAMFQYAILAVITSNQNLNQTDNQCNNSTFAYNCLYSPLVGKASYPSASTRRDETGPFSHDTVSFAGNTLSFSLLTGASDIDEIRVLTATPEVGTLFLMGIGLLAVVGMRRWRCREV